MIINSKGYALDFIQKQIVADKSAHLFSYIFRFKSPKTKLIYIARAEYHKEDFFGIKFYAKIHKRSDYRYSKIINRGDISNILVTCAKVVPLLLKEYPKASFGFIGARSIDRKKKVESYCNNQRYKVYTSHIPSLFGNITFTHFCYEEMSSYLLVNNLNTNIYDTEQKIKQVVKTTYNTILDVN